MIKILFICHGNICRSTSAQFIMQQLLDEGRVNDIVVDSAATSREEIGNRVYPPMKKVLEGHGVSILDHRARQLTQADYDGWDMLVAMDQENLRGMKRILGSDPAGKVRLLTEFAGWEQDADVPVIQQDAAMDGFEKSRRISFTIDDPWYTRDFERTYREILDCCRGLYRYLQHSPEVSTRK